MRLLFLLIMSTLSFQLEVHNQYLEGWFYLDFFLDLVAFKKFYS